MEQKSGKGLAIAGLVLGIVACALFWATWINIVTMILGVVGIVLSIMGSKKSKLVGEPTGIATAGLVLSIIGTVLSVIGFFTCTVCVMCVVSEANSEINDILQSYGY